MGLQAVEDSSGTGRGQLPCLELGEPGKVAAGWWWGPEVTRARWGKALSSLPPLHGDAETRIAGSTTAPEGQQRRTKPKSHHLEEGKG